MRILVAGLVFSLALIGLFALSFWGQGKIATFGMIALFFLNIFAAYAFLLSIQQPDHESARHDGKDAQGEEQGVP